MSQASAGARRVFSLSTKLHTQVKGWCKPAKPPPPHQLEGGGQQPGFVPKICCQLGTCVCGSNRNSLYLFENLKLCFKHIFWNKKKQKEMSFPRKLMEAGLIILEFTTTIANAANALQSDWDDTDTDCPETFGAPVYLHVGKTNFSTWHFGTLRLYPSDMQSHSSKALLLEPGPYATDQLDVFSDVEAFKHLLDLNNPVKMSIFTISFDEDDWPVPLVINDPSVPVIKVEDQPEIIVWHGLQEEENRRKKTEKTDKTRSSQRSGARTRTQRPGARSAKSGGRAGRGKKRKLHMADDPHDQGDDLGIAGNSDEEEPHQDDLRSMFGLYDSNSDSDSDSDRNSDISVPGNNFDEDHDPENPEIEPLSESSDSDWGSDTRDDNSGAQPPDALSEPAASVQVAPQPVVASVDSDVVAPRERAPAAREGDRRRFGFRDTHSIEVFPIPGLGELRFYPQHNHITAFCGKRTCEHAPDCRMQRTVAPKGGSSGRSSGRPIGLLIAWLRQSDKFDHADGHKHSYRISLEERQDARTYFESLPNWRDFARFEREVADGEPSEPLKIR